MRAGSAGTAAGARRARPEPATLAVSLGVYVALGLAEASGDVLYNSQVLLGPTGEVLAVRRKVNFIDLDEESGFTAGDRLLLGHGALALERGEAGLLVDGRVLEARAATPGRRGATSGRCGATTRSPSGRRAAG